MASYKQPCIQCGELIDRDGLFCPKCGSHNPFGYHCPYCRKAIDRGDLVCAGCGITLIADCPYCSEQTFVGAERCDSCDKSLMVLCDNKHCSELQYFLSTRRGSTDGNQPAINPRQTSSKHQSSTSGVPPGSQQKIAV